MIMTLMNVHKSKFNRSFRKSHQTSNFSVVNYTFAINYARMKRESHKASPAIANVSKYVPVSRPQITCAGRQPCAAAGYM